MVEECNLDFFLLFVNLSIVIQVILLRASCVVPVSI